MERPMKIALGEALAGSKAGKGGPFGAAIVRNGKVIAKAHNNVLAGNDPTAHAEIVAIRKAAKKLGTFDLSGCVVYSTCEPCPMGKDWQAGVWGRKGGRGKDRL
ncbi:MAG TPA: nucleoside deaminase [Candidatus Micrarchaeota archaeon]|nr:nucleoside deaminase [Candidatus Micrarchaeota archaeon]